MQFSINQKFYIGFKQNFKENFLTAYMQFVNCKWIDGTEDCHDCINKFSSWFLVHCLLSVCKDWICHFFHTNLRFKFLAFKIKLMDLTLENLISLSLKKNFNNVCSHIILYQFILCHDWLKLIKSFKIYQTNLYTYFLIDWRKRSLKMFSVY